MADTIPGDYTYYVNGSFLPAAAAQLPITDLGLMRGYGVFEALRTYGAQPFALREHLERLQRSADQIDLPLPGSLAELEAIVQATLAQNDPTNVIIRILVTGGPSTGTVTPDGKPSLLVIVAPVKPPMEHLYTHGARLISVDLQRFMPTVKSISYITAVMGQRRANQAGAVEALYRTPSGLITECTTSNLFLFRGDELITAGDDVLPGITRQFVLDLASGLFTVTQRPVHYAELGVADEAFITSTTKELMPIVQVDDIRIGVGRPGARTQRLAALFTALTQRTALPVGTPAHGQP